MSPLHFRQQRIGRHWAFAIIDRFRKGPVDNVDKPPGLSEVIPAPATKPGPPKSSLGPGPETFIEGAETLEEKGFNQFQRAIIEEADLDPTKPSTFDLPAQVFEDVPPIQPEIGQARRVRPTTAIELRGRNARIEARGLNPPSEVDELADKVFDQIQDLEDALRLPPTSSQSERQALGTSKRLLQNFKREAARAAEEARRTGKPELLNALLDRLSK